MCQARKLPFDQYEDVARDYATILQAIVSDHHEPWSFRILRHSQVGWHLYRFLKVSSPDRLVR